MSKTMFTKFSFFFFHVPFFYYCQMVVLFFLMEWFAVLLLSSALSVVLLVTVSVFQSFCDGTPQSNYSGVSRIWGAVCATKKFC